ncbi:Hypothetical protein SMAX5B_001398 [Scophthalmus maximus]|uniref:Uncharacterized protein n=1 Tax=Scophthalmus maximus TaxID=52904 RepID=A0A2U9CP07_SCOMX|nr:Hypothetical protein SMAX5B_001398 [Scophthalmus maximus]
MEDEELQVLLRRYKSVSGLVNRAVGERDKTDYGRDMGQERTHYFLQDGMCSSSVMNFIRSWSQPAVLQLPLFAKHNPSSCSEWRDNEVGRIDNSTFNLLFEQEMLLNKGSVKSIHSPFTIKTGMSYFFIVNMSPYGDGDQRCHITDFGGEVEVAMSESHGCRGDH